MSHTLQEGITDICSECSAEQFTGYYWPRHVSLMLSEKDARIAALEAALKTLATTMGCQCLTDKYPGDEHDSVFCVTVSAALAGS